MKEVRRSRVIHRMVSRKFYQRIVTRAQQPYLFPRPKSSRQRRWLVQVNCAVYSTVVVLLCRDFKVAAISQELVDAIVEDTDWVLRQLGTENFRGERESQNMFSIAQVRLMTCESGFEDGDKALGKALSGNFPRCAERMADIGAHVMIDYMC